MHNEKTHGEEYQDPCKTTSDRCKGSFAEIDWDCVVVARASSTFAHRLRLSTSFDHWQRVQTGDR